LGAWLHVEAVQAYPLSAIVCMGQVRNKLLVSSIHEMEVMTVSKRMRILAVSLTLIGCLGAGPMNEEGHMVLYEPSAAPLSWWVVNDTVMGGRSSSQWNDSSTSMGIFSGYLSLDNNGGFASVRSSETQLLPPAVKSIRLKVRGDGRTYTFAVRTRRIGRGVSYQKTFETRAKDWTVVTLALDTFQPRWRGRLVSAAPQLKAEDIQSIGFLLADKTEGSFRLDVAEISSVVNAPSLTP